VASVYDPNGGCKAAGHSPDRAAAVTTAILQIIEQHTGAPEGALCDALTDYLRDEIADTVRQTLNEIRLEDD
jgi:hypothetical protein